MLLAVATLYAAQQIFDVNIKTTVQLGISAEDPLQILSGDGQTPIESGDTISFGNVDVDFWGTGPVPMRKVFVKNTSNTPEHVVVTGDLNDGVLPLFGLTEDNLKPWPDNGFDLAASGDTGDTVMGWLGLKFLDLTAGGKSTTIIFRATAIMGDAGPDPIHPPAGMVGWWPGDGNAKDIVGGNHVTLSGDAPFSKGMVGQAFKFAGNGHVDIGDVADFEISSTSSMSITTWVKMSRTNVAYIVNKFDKFSPDFGWTIRIHESGSLLFEIVNADDRRGIDTTRVDDDQWHHITATHDGSTGKMNLYVDGVLRGSATENFGAINDGGTPFKIGEGFQGGGGVHGLVDEVAFFNRALTAAEVKSVFDAGSAGMIKPVTPQPIQPPAGMVAWWPGDGNANDIVDGNHGTLQGGATFVEGMVGEAFSLDGVDDFVDMGDVLDMGTSSFSIDLWYKASGSSAGRVVVRLVSKGLFGSEGGYGFQLEPGELNFTVEGGGNHVPVRIPPPSPGLFHHLAGVVDRGQGTVKLYVDGALAGQTSFAALGSLDTSLPLTFGHGIGVGVGILYFQGLIDEAEIFNRALSDAEIRAIYDAGSAGKVKP